MSDNGDRARDLDWSKYVSSMPLEPVVYPTGKAKAALVARLRRAWARVRPASAIEAAAAGETEDTGAVHESAVGNAETPNTGRGTSHG